MIRGKVLGGMTNPSLFSREQIEREYDYWKRDYPSTRVLRIRVSYEAVAEVIM